MALKMWSAGVLKRVKSVGPKVISPSFDDNKIYVVMFLTILFGKVSG